MHNTIKRILLAYWLAVACGVLPVLAQAPPQIDAGSRPAVNQLAAVAHAIKECPRELLHETKQGKELVRHYAGPPQNVVWDVERGTSIRAPYLGYIEFFVEYTRWDASSSTFVNDLISLTPRRRYEFDVSPKGLQLARMLHYAGPTRTELFDDPPDETCWQKAARDVQGMSNDSSKIQIQEGAQAEVGGVSVEVVSGSQYNASFGLIGRDEGTHYIVRSGDTVYLLSCSRQWRWEAKCPVLAAGEKFTLAIDAKNQVHLTGARGGKPVDIKLEYKRSEQLPSRTSGASADGGQPASPAAYADPRRLPLVTRAKHS